MIPILQPKKKRCTEMKVMEFEMRQDGSDKLRNLRQGMKEERLKIRQEKAKIQEYIALSS